MFTHLFACKHVCYVLTSCLFYCFVAASVFLFSMSLCMSFVMANPVLRVVMGTL